MSLDDLRSQINAIDNQILALLAARADVATVIAREKAKGKLPVFDPERERSVLDRLARQGAGRFPSESIRTVFREVMSACASLQAPISVAFLGPEGTWSHVAARHLFGLAARYTETTSIDGVFDAVRRGASIYGVVPFENSTEGAVTRAVDALLEGGVFIRREFVLEISQCLLSNATQLPDIERVYSHPQPLAQCRSWLATNLASAQLIQTASTATAARDATSDPKGAAIGSRLAGELLGLPILRERIQDRTENATRFVMLAKEDAPRTGDDKTTLGFSLRDGRGALRRVLEIFDVNAVNLTRIESRPSGQRAWDYVFLVDLEGHREDEKVARVVAELSARCESVTLMGSYPRHRGNEGDTAADTERHAAGEAPAPVANFEGSGGDDDHRRVSGG